MRNELKEVLSKLESLEREMRTVNEKPYTSDQASEYLGITKSYLYKLTHRNEIKHFKPGGKIVYFRKNDLDAWAFSNPVRTKVELRSAV